MKKILLIISFVLVNGFVFSQIAIWNPAANPNSTGLWTEGANWEGLDGDYPNSESVKVVFSVANSAECVLKDSVMTYFFVIGDDGTGEANCVVRVAKGGILSTKEMWGGIGWNSPGKLIVEEGGVVNFDQHMWVGWESEGTCLIDGGTVNVAEMFGTAFEGNAGSGYTYVKNGGVLNLTNIHPEQSIPDGSFIDIYGGQVTLAGDRVDDINAYIEDDKIMAYEGNSDLVVSYNETADVTVIMAPSVTFKVNMNQVSDLVNGGKVWVSLDNWDDYEVMTDDDGDGIYTISVANDRIINGTYFFAYQNGVDEAANRVSENLTGADCADASGYRTVTTTDSLLVLSPVLFNSCSEATQAAITVWTGGSSTLWSDARNWSDGFVPKDNKVVFNVSGAPDCVLNTESTISQFVLGDGGKAGTLTVDNGGTLTTTTGWSGIAWSDSAKFVVNEGGTVNFAEHAWIGWDGDAVVELNGGTINVGGMYGTAFEGGNGSASVYVNEGELNLAQFHESKSIPEGSFMDIAEGKVNITGNYLEIVNAYVAEDRIIAYGGSGTVNVELNQDSTLTIISATNVTAVDDFSSSAKVENYVYPNPTNGIINIKNPSLQGKFSYSIYTITGKLIDVEYNVEDALITKNISELDKGIYVVKVATEESSFIQKVVLN